MTFRIDAAFQSPGTATLSAGTFLLDDYFADDGILPDTAANAINVVLIEGINRTTITPALSVSLGSGSEAKLEIISVSHRNDVLTIQFTGTPGFSGWGVEGSEDLASFDIDLSDEAVIQETMPGTYLLSLDANERWTNLFVRIRGR